LLLGLVVLLGVWAYCFVLNSPSTPLEIFGFELRRREKFVVLLPFTVVVVTFTGMINGLLYVVLLSSMVSLPHACFHEVAELDALDILEIQSLQPVEVG